MNTKKYHLIEKENSSIDYVVDEIDKKRSIKYVMNRSNIPGHWTNPNELLGSVKINKSLDNVRIKFNGHQLDLEYCQLGELSRLLNSAIELDKGFSSHELKSVE